MGPVGSIPMHFRFIVVHNFARLGILLNPSDLRGFDDSRLRDRASYILDAIAPALLVPSERPPAG